MHSSSSSRITWKLNSPSTGSEIYPYTHLLSSLYGYWSVLLLYLNRRKSSQLLEIASHDHSISYWSGHQSLSYVRSLRSICPVWHNSSRTSRQIMILYSLMSAHKRSINSKGHMFKVRDLSFDTLFIVWSLSYCFIMMEIFLCRRIKLFIKLKIKKGVENCK